MSKRAVIPYLEEVRHTPHICLAEALRAANRAINKRYAEFLADLNISSAQVSLLMRLYYLREAELTQLARHMETDRTTIARNVDLLVNSGHVEIIPGKDRRSKLARLTPAGFALLERAVPKWQAAQTAVQEELGTELWGRALGDLRSVVKVGGMEFDRRAR